MAVVGETASTWGDSDTLTNTGGLALTAIWYEVPYQKMSTKYFHAWRTWDTDLPVDAEGWLELVVRTWDNAMNTQPTYVRSAW